ncbi:MAG: hypothetical protein HN403_01085 [Rhodospirillales bacterium]|jgi:long-chain fatty acid transport protein|nr:hypothetical protein [Rhodospirillales bacterium]
MLRTSLKSIGLVAVVATSAAMFPGKSANATNGFLGICTGAKNCGMAGAGVALPQDASSGHINPALMGRVKDQVFVSPGWFHPVRSLDRTKAVDPFNYITEVDEKSMMENFPEGAAGINYRLNDEMTAGLSVAGSGGMHTKYATPRSLAGSGAGETSVRYRLGHATPNLTWNPNDWSIYGVGLQIGWSDFKTNMGTNNNFIETKGANQTETAWGLGLRIGGLWDVNEKVTIGATAATPTWFSRFAKYNDLLEGSLDTPANGAIGVVYKVSPDTDIALDAKYIAWGAVFPMANTPRKTSGPGGGFGWESKPVFTAGVQHRLNDTVTLRAGYNYGASPIPDDKIFANALFPAITEHHVAAGMTYNINESWEVSASGFYAFEAEQTDDGSGDQHSVIGEGVRVDMWQIGAQVGLSYNF